MKYSELVESGADEAKRLDYLVESMWPPITLRVPKNLKDAAVEEVGLCDVGFSAFIRAH